jgi:hypothetical protein
VIPKEYYYCKLRNRKSSALAKGCPFFRRRRGGASFARPAFLWFGPPKRRAQARCGRPDNNLATFREILLPLKVSRVRRSFTAKHDGRTVFICHRDLWLVVRVVYIQHTFAKNVYYISGQCVEWVGNRARTVGGIMSAPVAPDEYAWVHVSPPGKAYISRYSDRQRERFRSLRCGPATRHR